MKKLIFSALMAAAIAGWAISTPSDTPKRSSDNG